MIEGIADSKKLSPSKRSRLYTKITDDYTWGIGIVSPDEIDAINILEAAKKACRISVEVLKIKPDVVLVDGNMKFCDPRYKSIIKGDALCLSIAAASIIAKVTRDRIMQELDLEYPVYNWRQNMGYPTKAHFEAIAKYGLSKHHRRSFNCGKTIPNQFYL